MECLHTQGISLPRLGLGTFRMPSEVCRPAVESALTLGYRHIDTAGDVRQRRGGGSRARGLGGRSPRDPRHHQGLAPETWLPWPRSRRSFDASLQKLGSIYVDLYLVVLAVYDQRDLPAMFRACSAGCGWKAATRCHRGVAELHGRAAAHRGRGDRRDRSPTIKSRVPGGGTRSDARSRYYLKSKFIPLVAYCPLAQGMVAQSPELTAIGRKHGGTAAQVSSDGCFRAGGRRGDSEGAGRIASSKPISMPCGSRSMTTTGG